MLSLHMAHQAYDVHYLEPHRKRSADLCFRLPSSVSGRVDAGRHSGDLILQRFRVPPECKLKCNSIGELHVLLLEMSALQMMIDYAFDEEGGTPLCVKCSAMLGQ